MTEKSYRIEITPNRDGNLDAHVVDDHDGSFLYVGFAAPFHSMSKFNVYDSLNGGGRIIADASRPRAKKALRGLCRSAIDGLMRAKA